MNNILIAGGTGLIGKRLTSYFESTGNAVFILTRKPTAANHIYWNPSKKEIDTTQLGTITHLINLCGASLAGKRWSNAYKKELLDSRVEPAQFLLANIQHFSNLNHYITASGINCYPLNQAKIYTETDDFGTDFVSQLVKQWEETADLFSSHCIVSKIRISPVLDNLGGALQEIMKPIKAGFGAALGNGQQAMPWIHHEDLARIFAFVMEHQLAGAYNALAANSNNQDFTKVCAASISKKIWLPNLPAFMVKLLFGEMSMLLLEGVQASHEKLTKAGFTFQHTDLNEAISSLNKG
jgi:uncharacterized protein (TIGR01777 family)